MGWPKFIRKCKFIFKISRNPINTKWYIILQSLKMFGWQSFIFQLNFQTSPPRVQKMRQKQQPAAPASLVKKVHLPSGSTTDMAWGRVRFSPFFTRVSCLCVVCSFLSHLPPSPSSWTGSWFSLPPRSQISAEWFLKSCREDRARKIKRRDRSCVMYLRKSWLTVHIMPNIRVVIQSTWLFFGGCFFVMLSV